MRAVGKLPLKLWLLHGLAKRHLVGFWPAVRRLMSENGIDFDAWNTYMMLREGHFEGGEDL